MKRLTLMALALALATLPAFAQGAPRVRNNDFASDFQTVPVMGNTPGAFGAVFATYVTLLNPTSNAFAVDVTLYDNAGTKRNATIQLAAHEQKAYPNFLDAVFGYTGGGAVTFKAPETAGGTHNNRFIVSAEIWTVGTGRYGTSLPTLEFAGRATRSFTGGVTVSSTSRTNIGCFNQADAANTIKVTVLDASGQQTLGTFNLNLAANAWGQAGVSQIVTNGYVQFDPSDSAVCYAVTVDNSTNDGRLSPAVEYVP